MTRIQFLSAERPSRISKALARALADAGHHIPYMTVREAVAEMYGYRNWNDLLAQVGKQAPSPYDQDLDSLEAEARRSIFVARLADLLSLPREVAALVVDQVGPTSRAKRSLPKPRESWDIIARRISAGLAARASEIRPMNSSDATGVFVALKPEIRMHDFILSVTNQGEVEFWTGHDLQIDNRSSDFGRILHMAGLAASSDEQAHLPSPAPLLNTVSRLDPDALHLLRATPTFSVAAYRLAKASPLNGPIRETVSSYPLLGNVFESRARREDIGQIAEDEPTSDANPVEAYLNQVATWVSGQWPHLEFNRANADHALRSVGALELLPKRGLSVSDIALLAFAPAAAVPKTANQLKAFMNFVDDELGLFYENRMLPAVFFDAFGKTSGYDWAKLLGQRAKSQRTSLLSAIEEDIGGTVGRALALELGMNPLALSDNEASIEIGERLTRRVCERRGYLELSGVMKAWDEISYDDIESDDDACRAMYCALSTTKLLPEELSGLSAADLVGKLGLTIRDIVDPEEGLIVNKNVFHKLAVGNLTFQAVMGQHGPYITAISNFRSIGDVPLGDAPEIHLTEGANRGPKGWYICKYDKNQPRISLLGLTADQIRLVASEFAIPISHQPYLHEHFMTSPCFERLLEWVSRRPELAASFADCEFHHLPGLFGAIANAQAASRAL